MTLVQVADLLEEGARRNQKDRGSSLTVPSARGEVIGAKGLIEGHEPEHDR